MRKRGKPDAGQSQDVDYLRKYMGWSVKVTSQLGDGFGDFIVGAEGVNLIFEKKNKGGKLTPNEQDWQIAWRGQVFTCYDIEEVIHYVRGKVIGS
jgi:hypothetical protein